MALEIERKFLVTVIPDLDKVGITKNKIKQGYIFDWFNTVIRTRRSNDTGFLTIKRTTGLDTLGVNEYEWSIPGWLASALMYVSFLGKIEKTRYNVVYKGHMFELDIFEGKNSGLVIVEVELDNPDEFVALPEWVGEEVTGIKTYYNKNLAKGKK